MYGRVGNRAAKSSTSALLQRVSSQLQGKIIQDDDISDDDDDLNAYLSSLSKKKISPAQPKWDKYGEASDLSVSDDEVLQPVSQSVTTGSSLASKFLKKKAPSTEQTTQSASQQSRKTGLSSAEKRANFANMHSSLGQRHSQINSNLSDSDLDMNLSMDEEVLADVQSWKKKTGNKQDNHKAAESDDSSSMKIGRGGSKFLKKKSETKQEQSSSVKGKRSSQSRKHSSGGTLDTDDDTRSEMYGMRSHSNSSHTPTPPKERRREKENRKSSVQSLDEIDEDSYPLHGRVLMAFSGDSESSDEGIKLNIMELDDLQPITRDSDTRKKTTSKKTKKGNNNKSDSEDDVFNVINIQTVDELLGAADELSVASEVKTEGGTSEIKTEPYESDFEATSASGKGAAPLKSILATPRSPKTTPRSARGRVRYSLDDDIKIRSRSPSPEVISTAHASEVSSVIHTEESLAAVEISSARSVPEEVDGSGSETYTEDYSEEFSTLSGRSSPDRSYKSRQNRHSFDQYSDDFTSATEGDDRTKTRTYSRSSSRDAYSDDYTSYTESSRSRTPSPDVKQKRARKRRDRKVQTGLDMGLLYHWDPRTSGSAILGPQYGMAFVDPTPIATHVVSAEALEAVTAYSPSVIALNDMLRQQLQLTTHFLETQKRIHDSLTHLVPPDYQYTTLADTKKFIQKHKKRTITFDEALKQVKAEMGIP